MGRNKKGATVQYIEKYITPSGNVCYKYPFSRYVANPRRAEEITPAMILYASKVIKAVSEETNIPEEDIWIRSCLRKYTYARNMIWYILKMKARYDTRDPYWISLKTLTKYYGGRHHTSVNHALERVSWDLEYKYPETTDLYNKVMERLNEQAKSPV